MRFARGDANTIEGKYRAGERARACARAAQHPRRVSFVRANKGFHSGRIKIPEKGPREAAGRVLDNWNPNQ